MSTVLKSISATINFEKDQNESESVTEFCEKIDLSLSEGSEFESIRILQTKINQVITDEINTLKAANKLVSEPVDFEAEDEDDTESEEEE